MPLSSSDGWWGILRASSDRPDHVWDTPTIKFLRAAADMVAVSMRQWEAAGALVQAKDDAEAANRAKSTFLSTMSHELRTPLTAILGYSQLIERQLEVGDYTTIATDMRYIHDAGQHLFALINDMLDLSRIEAGKISVELYPVDIPDLAQALVATVGPLVAQNRNTLRLVCPEVMAPMYTDATRLRQVLLNLLNNAAKFTEAGAITLSVSLEDVASAPWVVFGVADTGIGIDASQMHRLFMPFSQIDDSLNRKYGGTGLGLALSRRICQLLGGDISVESRLGAGAVFTVRLPMNRP
jgi:signal transduction histidine kinase